MSKRERLASLRTLLEYATDELEAVGLDAAAGLVADAMARIEDELDGPASSTRPKSSASSRRRRLRLVSDRSSIETRSRGS